MMMRSMVKMAMTMVIVVWDGGSIYVITAALCVA
jgi:hypothetical protein